MNYTPKVTIIIPVYNGSEYLNEAIDCALAQTYKNLEILVVNDGSTDDGASEKIALSYGEKIRYYHKENGGVSSALNFAFTKMEGEWFSWLSHDDLYYPEKIEEQIKYINRLIDENPEIDLNKITVRTATESIDKFGTVIRTPDYSGVAEHESPVDTALNNVYNYRLSGCSFLLPTACIADVGNFREDIRTVSDVEYWYRLLFAGYEFYCLKKVLVKNRSHKQQVGKTRVSLFDTELNNLHIAIADMLYSTKAENLKELFIKYYIGLNYRQMPQAIEYVKTTYIKELATPFEYKVTLPLKCAALKTAGSLRTVARDIYRKIKVK